MFFPVAVQIIALKTSLLGTKKSGERILGRKKTFNPSSRYLIIIPGSQVDIPGKRITSAMPMIWRPT